MYGKLAYIWLIFTGNLGKKKTVYPMGHELLEISCFLLNPGGLETNTTSVY